MLKGIPKKPEKMCNFSKLLFTFMLLGNFVFHISFDLDSVLRFLTSALKRDYSVIGSLNLIAFFIKQSFLSFLRLPLSKYARRNCHHGGGKRNMRKC